MQQIKVIFLISICLVIANQNVSSQTLVSGNVSGTWDVDGSPYNVIDNCTVPAGTILTIDPGVEVIIGENLKIDVNGRILAVGLPTQPIVFTSPNSSVHWDRININFGGGISKFQFCEMGNANIAIFLSIIGSNSVMKTEIVNCRIKNCLQAGIAGESIATTGCRQFGGCFKRQPQLNPVIKNNYITNCETGCEIIIQGERRLTGGGGSITGLGAANPIITNNIFNNNSGTALKLNVGSRPANSKPRFSNNTIINCEVGLSTQEPYDVEIRNNIFYGTSTAIERSGSLSSYVGFNCFFNNDTNFLGYPESFGQVVTTNGNGEPSDIALNIFSDPLFDQNSDFRLTELSPCIDAGDPGESFTDRCFPPSFTTETNDIGAYGGFEACLWDNQPPTLSPIENVEIDEGQELTIPISVTDLDHDQNLRVTFGENPPAGAEIMEDTQVFHWTPSESQGPGVYTISAIVTDSGVGPLDDRVSFEITVNEVNKKPDLTVNDLSINEVEELDIIVQAIDTDQPSNLLTFTLDDDSLGLGATIDAATGALFWKPTVTLEPESYSIPFTVTVTDDGSPSMSDSKTFMITVISGSEFADADGDMLSDQQELLIGTDPNKSDTDDDGMPDRWEFVHGLDPKNGKDAEGDSDNDAVSNLQEFQNDTDPNKYVIRLEDGWNLIALTRIPKNNQVFAIFGNRISGHCWEWKNGQFHTLTEILPFRGYWMYSEVGGDVEILLP